MKKYTKAERQEHVERWKKGALSKAAYAKSVGINETTFYTWAKGAASEGQGFVEISAQIKQEQAHRILIEKGDVKIHVPLSVWAESFAVIMEGLKAAI